MRHTITIVLVVGVAMASGCHRDAVGVGEEDSPSLTTDRSTYVAECVEYGSSCGRYELRVIATYSNPTRDTVYLGRDRSQDRWPAFWVLTDDTSGSAYNGHLRAGERPDSQFVVPPGRSRTDTLPLYGPSVWNIDAGEYEGVLEGEFKLKYMARACRGLCAEVLGVEATFSNPFLVQLSGSGG